MGTSLNNVSSYIYKVNEYYNKEITNYYAIFDKSPFTQGEFRYCYKGEIRDENKKLSKPDIFPSGKCVIKVMRKKTAYDFSDFKKDFRNLFYSAQVSKDFNSYYNYKCPELHFIKPYAAKICYHGSFELFDLITIKDSDSMNKIKENEWIAIEPFIDGEYEVFVSNTYWTNKYIDETIPFFMHWNWVNTKGEKLVSDIQGVRREKYYELIDPAVQGINQEYGDGDLGCFGLIAFLIRHKHNKYCKDLPWPEESEIKRYFFNISLMEMRRTIFVNELKRK